ncbi:hypothetical protein CON21_26255 [Bacillus thuringiensis]|uniref:hypothetical protein n=1 Tax=Bacillus thuringiensis TaxID=1428 RepID=UPI000BEE3D4F|nr:hypothetical protein [Bacillus thuringiensis]PEE97786.1 hypothetical protein CON21_26255 [Bacillus thuringiensis]
MNWEHFQTYNDAPTQAFETMCNQLFELWCKREYKASLDSVTVVNGSGGDGGVEAFATLKDNSIVGVQAKWFRSSITDGQMTQIKNSIKTAIEVRPNLIRYIVCVPRDLNSIKKGREGKVVTNTESTRWDSLKKVIQKEYPLLELILWDETKILSQLQQHESSGIYRYWFEKSEISYENLKYSYNLQKSGWLSQKYTPVLHQEGAINNQVSQYLGTSETRKNVFNQLKNIKELCNCIERLIDDYIEFIEFRQIEKSDLNHLVKIKNEFEDVKVRVAQLIEILVKEKSNQKLISYREFLIDIDFIYLILDEENISNEKRYFHISEIKKHVTKFEIYDFQSILSEIQFTLNQKLFVIVGNPGTGKTHGIAGTIENIFEKNVHLPILIRAKDINPSTSWKDIMTKVLGLSNNWGELEIWRGLESLSYRNETIELYKDSYNELKLVPKVIIFIEGLDESRPYDKWIEKLREVSSITEAYPRIKFCVTSRPYVFDSISYADNLLKNVFRLQSTGDVPVNQLFSIYINHFNVDIGSSNWIKWSLKSPLSLRLFCENYRNQNVSNIDNSATTITNLLKEKIKILEEEFIKTHDLKVGRNNHIIKSSLIAISRLFIEKERIPLPEIEKALTNLIPVINNQELVSSLIQYLENYGLLQSFEEYSESFFSDSKRIFSVGIQPIFDYIFALKLYESGYNYDDMKIPEQFLKQNGAIMMLSILLMEEHSYLLSENSCIKQSYLDSNRLSLTCFTLANVSITAAEKYKEYIAEVMRIDAEHLKKIVDALIKVVSRIKGHPLGSKMLHDYMMEFSLAAERDIIWSVPSNIVHDINEKWTSYTSIQLDHENYQLKANDFFDGLPLIYAWLLTTVNNSERVKYRATLGQWAVNHPLEFFKLFQLVIKTNDIQMKEDIYSIAAGSVLANQMNEEFVKSFCNWIIKFIYPDINICRTNNIAIRYYTRSILESGYRKGYINEATIERCRPPYFNKEDIPIDITAITGSRMGGYGPIDYDLSRYVLIDQINSSFFYTEEEYSDSVRDEIARLSDFFELDEVKVILKTEDLEEEIKIILNGLVDYYKNQQSFWTEISFVEDYGDSENSASIEEEDDVGIAEEFGERFLKKGTLNFKYNIKAEKLMNRYMEKYDIQNFTSDQFILCAAYNYLIKQGWKEDVFITHSSSDNKEHIIGIDSAIRGRFHAATHGAKSGVMSFCEKYIWIAKNEILGYLADNLLFRDDDKPPFIIKNYTLLSDFPSPLQEIYQVDPEEKRKHTAFYLPENLSPEIEGIVSEETINLWMTDTPEPTIENWICIKDEKNDKELYEALSLFGYHSLSNQTGGETNMWITSVIIDKEHLPIIKGDFLNKKPYLLSMFNDTSDAHARIDNFCYITPKEVLLINENEEVGAIKKVITFRDKTFKEYSFNYTATECVSHFLKFGDVYYTIPSKYVRSLLNITDGDGYKFYDENLEEIGFYRIAGEPGVDQQSYLCINKEKLLNNLEREQKSIVWIVRIMREATPKAREKYRNVNGRYNEYYMLWFENGEMQQIKLHSDDNY